MPEIETLVQQAHSILTHAKERLMMEEPTIFLAIIGTHIGIAMCIVGVTLSLFEQKIGEN